MNSATFQPILTFVYKIVNKTIVFLNRLDIPMFGDENIDMSAHACDAIVVSCIDFRFQKYIREWLEENYKNKTYDYVGFAGATKDLETILKQIDISVRLHDIKEAVLIHHEDCGAYGTESTPERHSEDLKKAAVEILSRFPNLNVNLYYLHLDGNFENIK